MSGDPLDLAVTVKALRRDAFQHYLGGSRRCMGDCALLSVDGIDIVVNSVRVQTFSPDVFTNLGLDPATKRYVVVKSMNHFRAGFDPLAKQTIYVAVPVRSTSIIDAYPTNVCSGRFTRWMPMHGPRGEERSQACIWSCPVDGMSLAAAPHPYPLPASGERESRPSRQPRPLMAI